MSPDVICPQCGKEAVFHQDEIDALLDGEDLYCTDCALELTYNEFLAEVMDGKHPKLMEMLRERLAEEDE